MLHKRFDAELLSTKRISFYRTRLGECATDRFRNSHRRKRMHTSREAQFIYLAKLLLLALYGYLLKVNGFVSNSRFLETLNSTVAVSLQ